jgi:hypothetical protein
MDRRRRTLRLLGVPAASGVARRGRGHGITAPCKSSLIREHGPGPSARTAGKQRRGTSNARAHRRRTCRPAAAVWRRRRAARRRRWSCLPRAAGQRPRGAVPGTHGPFGCPVRFGEKRARRPRSQGAVAPPWCAVLGARSSRAARHPERIAVHDILRQYTAHGCAERAEPGAGAARLRPRGVDARTLA